MSDHSQVAPRSDGEITRPELFERASSLAHAWAEANAEWTVWHDAHWQRRAAYGTEEWVREEMDKTRLCTAVNTARAKYDAACDALFLAPRKFAVAAE